MTDQTAASSWQNDVPEVDHVARDCKMQRLGLVLEINAESDQVQLQDLTTGLPWWAKRGVVRRLSAREELSLRLAATEARALHRRVSVLTPRGLQ